MSEAVRTQRRGKVLEVTLDRPPANAIDKATSQALYDAFRTLQDDDDLLIGIITGAGERIFSAGWDLKAVAAAESPDEVEGDESPGGFAGLTEFWDLYKPVIAAVNGATVGGGFELALSADIILAAEHAEFWLPEMERGFLASAGAIQRLPRRIPYNVAMELFLTGRHMDAAEAKHWGLVSEVLPADRLMERARALADKCKDISELLDELEPRAPRHALSLRVAYHDACHLQHAQGVSQEPRRVLRAIPDLTLCEIPEAGICCGSAGIYNLVEPEAAGELGDRKARNIRSTGAEAVVSSNPGCLLQIANRLETSGRRPPTYHLVELVDASIRGASLPS